VVQITGDARQADGEDETRNSTERRRDLARPRDAGTGRERRMAAIAASPFCYIQFPDSDGGITGCGKEDFLILLATLRAKLCVARKFDPKKRTLPSAVRSQIT
jgi:hypothetical protein